MKIRRAAATCRSLTSSEKYQAPPLSGSPYLQKHMIPDKKGMQIFDFKFFITFHIRSAGKFTTGTVGFYHASGQYTALSQHTMNPSNNFKSPTEVLSDRNSE